MKKIFTTEIEMGRYNKLTELLEQVNALTMIFYNYALFDTILILILCSICLVYSSDPLFGTKCILSYKSLLHNLRII